MGKILVLAEKPSVGRDLAKVLKCQKSQKSYIEGERYIVTWGLGHLIELAAPEAYDIRYKEWRLDLLPMLPQQMKLEVISKTSKQFSEVRKLLQRKDVEEIVIATDPAREGELVGRWIIEKAGVKKPMKRLWISSQTDKAIRDGFNKLQPASNYQNLYRAAVCRAEADWLVGLNVTRALTCRYNAQLSAGRVQSATLNMIIAREQEIKNFKPQPYYTIQGKAKGFTLKWQGQRGETRLFNEQEAERIVKEMEKSSCSVTEVTKSLKKQYAPAFYDLTELQRDANRLFGYSAKETLGIMQRLYENYKILTYPRTDSKYISTDIVPTLSERLKAIAVGEYRALVAPLLKTTIKGEKRYVDNSKVTDHHGIIPTEEKLNLLALSSSERKIYNLVVRRFLAVLSPAFEYEQTTLTVEVAGQKLVAKGKVEVSKGWKAIYEDNEVEEREEEGQLLPMIKKGEMLTLSFEIKREQTKAPARFNEGTLLAAMEKPHQYIHIESKYAKTLGETGGIGTVATRADIIEKLFAMYYIEKNGKEVIPTSKGKQLIELVPEDLKSPIMTAQWEKQLEEISQGKRKPEEFMTHISRYTKELVQTIKNSQEAYKHDNLTGKKCPKCGKYLLEVKGKQGMLYVCQDRACGHKETISRFTNTRCPQCHKKLELRGEGEGQIYVCTTCTFREKLSSFNKKYRNNNQKVDKKSVQRYLKEQQKEEEGNFAFAAFGDLFNQK